MGKLRKDQLELLKKIVNDKGDGVGLLFEPETLDKLEYGDFLIFAWWKEAGLDYGQAVFRLVQIREGEGDYGSDVFVGRLPGGDCMSFENTSLYRVKDKYKDDLRLVYDTHDAIEIDDDHKDIGYTVNGKKAVGFLIKKE